MIYDISSKESAIKTIVEFIKCPEDYLIHFIFKARNIYQQNLSNMDIRDKLLDELSINIDDISIDDLNIAFNHITTSNNSCQDIKEKGLRGLNDVLLEENELTDFLKKYNVYIDVRQKVISTNRGIKSIELNNNIDNELKKYFKIGNKIYFDFAICGFFYYSITHPYEGDVHKRPEILNEVSRVVDGVDLSKEWEITHKSYEVKAVIPLSKVNTQIFCSDKYSSDYGKDLKLELLNKALYMAYSDCEMENEICILKDNQTVLPSEIINIKRVDFAI